MQWHLVVEYENGTGLNRYTFDNGPMQSEITPGVIAYYGEVQGRSFQVFIVADNSMGWELYELERDQEE